jgi:uncharacterized protein
MPDDCGAAAAGRYIFSEGKMNDITITDGATPTVTPKKPFPSILVSAGWIILYFALQIVVTAVIIGVMLATEHSAAAAGGQALPFDPAAIGKDGVLIMWGLVASAAIQLALMWLYLRKDERTQQIGLTYFGHLSLGRTLTIAVGAVAAATIFNYVYANYVIPGMPMQDEMAKILASIPRTPLNMIVGFVAIAGAAPLIEELLFRGLLQKSLAHKMPVWAAITLSALVFSLVHMQPYAIPALMAIGAAFGYIYHKTGSLRVTIILHMINNAVALIVTQAV